MINPGVVAAIHVAGVRGDPCGAMRCKGLSPCDFDLIPKMKEPLRGIRFRTVPEILQALHSNYQHNRRC